MTTTTDTTIELPAVLADRRPQLSDVLSRPGTKVVMLAGSQDPNAKVTLVLLDEFGPAFVVKVPTTGPAGRVVSHEGELLDGLSRLALGPLATTLPQPVGYLSVDRGAALVTTALPGTPMTVRYHGWRHTARRRRVRADFAAAGAWLADLQTRTQGPRAPVTMLADALDVISTRFPTDARVPVLRHSLGPTVDRLARCSTPRTVVHGDYWFGNLLVSNDRVIGVVDWECGELAGEPLHDVARFACSYSLYLDRHVRPGRRVPGHRGLRRDGWGAGLVRAVSGDGWYAGIVRDYVRAALDRLGVRGLLWPDLMLAGIADVVATADHPGFAADHLDVLVRTADFVQHRQADAA